MPGPGKATLPLVKACIQQLGGGGERRATRQVAESVTNRCEPPRNAPQPATAAAHPTPRLLHPRVSRREADRALPAARIAPRQRPRQSGPPRISPRVSILRSTTNMSRHAGANVSRAAISRNTTPHRCRSWRAKRSTYSRRPHPRHDAAAPSVRARARTCGPAAAVAAPPVRIDQRAQVLEAVGRNQAGGHQLPQRVFHFAGRAPGISHAVRGRTMRLASEASKALRARDETRLRQVAAAETPAASRRPREGRAPAAQRAWAARAGRVRRSGARKPDAARGAPTSLRRRGRARPAAPDRSWRCGGEARRSPTRPPPIPDPATAGSPARRPRRRAVGCRPPDAASAPQTPQAAPW